VTAHYRSSPLVMARMWHAGGRPDGGHVRCTGVGLFVPKPSTGRHCQRRSTPGQGQTVRGCPLAYTVGGSDCHSLCHSVACARMACWLGTLGLRITRRIRVVHRYPPVTSRPGCALRQAHFLPPRLNVPEGPGVSGEVDTEGSGDLDPNDSRRVARHATEP
jgi:hypothetical protein